MSRDLENFALTRLQTHKYWIIQCNVERFVKIRIDKILIVQILTCSMRCFSRDLENFALTRF
uniref:Uncharacterized protein n=1 Tax=viral metagenome TaxID=1070528 RepID=A0A6C0C8S9_9ZZZZ